MYVDFISECFLLSKFFKCVRLLAVDMALIVFLG